MKRYALLAAAALVASTAKSEHPTLGFDDNVPQLPAAKDPKVLKDEPAKDAAAPPAPTISAVDNPVFPEFIRPRVSVRVDFGDGVGYNNGYTYVESFLPVWQDVGSWLVFNNLRAVTFQNADLWEINAGFGARRYNADTERILGAYAFYDGRTTLSNNYYNQVTLGWESLGQRFDFRNNFYIPVGTTFNQVGQSAAFDPRFQGYNIIFSRTRTFEAAQGGLDFEAGGLIPKLEQWAVRGYLGYYHYSGEGMPSIDGGRARLEANINDSLTLHFMVQNDQVNHTLVSGGVAMHFGPGKAQRGVPGASPYTRMGERVVRDPDIAVSQQNRTSPEVALDAVTGNPILVRHAASYAAPGGDGTFERPVQTLSALQGVSTPRDILFVHANSVFNNQSIVLQNNQRFLGEGLNYLFTSKQGTYLLPRATDGTMLPILRTSPGDMVTLANVNEVAGFSMQGAGGNAIFGKGISDSYLHDLSIVDASRNGIRFVDVGGVNVIENTNIVTPVASGISITEHGGVAGQFIVNNTSVTNAGRNGVVVRLHDGSQAYLSLTNGSYTGDQNGLRVVTRDASAFSATIAGNLFADSTRNGIYFSQHNQSTASATIQNNQFQNNNESHVSARVENQATGNFSILGNTMVSTNDTGIRLAARNQGSLNVNLTGNAVSQNAIFGLTVLQEGRSQVNASLVGNTFTKDGQGHIGIDLYDQSVGNYLLTGNTLNGTFGNGVFLGIHDRATVNSLTMTNNTITRSLIAGTLVQMENKATLTGAFIDGNTISQNLIFGMAFFQANQSQMTNAQISNNKFTDNGFVHVVIDLKDKSFGKYQLNDNVATGGFGASLIAAAENKSTMRMRLLDNTTNRPAFLFAAPKADFQLHEENNVLIPPAFAFVDPSIVIVP